MGLSQDGLKAGLKGPCTSVASLSHPPSSIRVPWCLAHSSIFTLVQVSLLLTMASQKKKGSMVFIFALHQLATRGCLETLIKCVPYVIMNWRIYQYVLSPLLDCRYSKGSDQV